MFIFNTNFIGLEVYLSNSALSCHVEGPGSNPQYCKRKKKKMKKTTNLMKSHYEIIRILALETSKW
jgi:hypothetical protein